MSDVSGRPAAGFALPKEARLLKRPQFLALTDRRRRPDLVFRTGSFLLLGRLNGLSFCRLGLTVSRKAGGSVTRSRFKRQVREFFRLRRNAWPSALDLLFIARAGAGAKAPETLAADLDLAEARLTSFGRPERAAGGGGRPPIFAARALSAAALSAIGFYQRFISPALPPACRFWPTCSHYAAEAIVRHGLGRGLILAARRLLKCHPLHPGGFDPVP